MSRKVLGRGLEALIPTSDPDIPRNEADLIDIPLYLIKVNPDQPRIDFGDEKLEELAQSIRSKGVIQPILVRKKSPDEGYELIAGERRLKAAKMADLMKIPARKLDIQDSELLEIALIENIQRKNLNPIEEANAYRKLLEQFQTTQEEIAGRLGIKRVTLANIVRLLNLPADVRHMISDGRLSAGHGKVLLAFPESVRAEYASRCASSGWSVRELERRRKKTEIMKNRSRVRRINPDIAALEDKLRSVLGTKVKIHNISKGGKQKGRIEISYYSAEEFDRLFELFGSSERASFEN